MAATGAATGPPERTACCSAVAPGPAARTFGRRHRRIAEALAHRTPRRARDGADHSRPRRRGHLEERLDPGLHERGAGTGQAGPGRPWSAETEDPRSRRTAGGGRAG